MSPSFLSRLGVSSPFDSNLTYITSPFLSPHHLFLVRSLFALFTLTTSLVVLATQATTFTNNVNGDEENSFLYYSYFTSLSYIGLTAYFVAAAVHTGVYAWKGVYLLRRWGRVCQVLHVLLFSSVVTFPLLVTVVYWALLASSSTFATPFSSFSSISQHILNTLLSLTELLFLSSTSTLPLLHLPILLILLGLYLCLAYLTHATQGIYVYSFLDPGKQGSMLAVYIVGIGIGECVVFGVVWVLGWLRWLIVRKAGRGKGRLRSCGPGVTDEEISEVDGGEKKGGDVAIEDDWEEIVMPHHPSSSKEYGLAV